jgi:cysteine desulfurase
MAMIYLDNNATTQPLPEVIEAVTGCMRVGYANPSSVHQFGQSARHQVERARESVARLIGAKSREIVFTSGGTESINLAIVGAVRAQPERRHVVTTAVEHSAVLRVAERLEQEGCRVDYIGVDQQGRVNEDMWREKITAETAVVSFQLANNETGVMQDVPRLAEIAAEKGALVHVDAVQAAGKFPLCVADWPVHLLSTSAHKFHGPKGVGALYVKRRARIVPLIIGGGQERELRGGTENVPGIVGMAIAAEAAMGDVVSGSESTINRVGQLRDRFERNVLGAIPFARVNGANAPRIPNTSNISFENLEAEAILILLSESAVCASSGSACSSGSLEPSHVLKAMRVEQRFAHGAIRFSLSKFTTEEELDQVVGILPELLGRLTVLTPR